MKQIVWQMLFGVPYIIFYAVFSIAVSIKDLRTGEIPRSAFAAAFPVLFILKSLWAAFSPSESIAGLTAGLLTFLAAYAISRGKLGLADVWQSSLTGLVLGPHLWFAAVGIACFLGIAFILVFRRRKIPFIPFLAFGGITMSVIQGLRA